MKKSINIMLFVFAVCASLPNMVFAQSTVEPMAGVPIGLEGDPGSIIIARTTTDVNGKFSFKIKEGKYRLKLSYDLHKRTLCGTDKNFALNPANYVIECFFELFTEVASKIHIYDRRDQLVRTPGKLIINNDTGVIKLTVGKGGGTLSGTLTYVKLKSSKDQINLKR
ncbi:MAG: hypothetical protein Q8S39_04585 [Ignavibacteria bacterium]|nr:hypothetical protein [Ignavibacteria bacterium]